MDDGLAITVIVAALAAAAFSTVMALLGRPPRLSQLIGLAVVELTMLIYGVVAIVRIFGSERPEDLPTFVGYLLTALLTPPLVAMFGWAERSRWGSVVIAGGCAVVAVLVVRLQQVWGVWS